MSAYKTHKKIEFHQVGGFGDSFSIKSGEWLSLSCIDNKDGGNCLFVLLQV